MTASPESGTEGGRKGQTLSMSEKERVSVQGNDMDRSRLHLSGELQGNKRLKST